jgi:hypothetical protein
MVIDAPTIMFTFAMRALLVACASVCCAMSSVHGQEKPADAKLADFKKLKFIEGNWRGYGYTKPFYESYRFLNDSTIETAAYTDSTFSRREPGGAVIAFRGGRIWDEGDTGYRWVVTRLNGGEYRFGPVAKATNSFIWRRESDDEWTAIIKGANGKTTTYRMERISP